MKQSEDALSAWKMPKNTPPPGKNWRVSVTRCYVNGKVIYGTNSRPADVILPNGEPQKLYFPAGHPQAGVFKGMAKILEEQGLIEESQLQVECKDFKCPTGQTSFSICHLRLCSISLISFL
jgi:hypothetical protein